MSPLAFRQALPRAIFAVLVIPLCSCVHAPAFSILGSYFPAWMLCTFAGILLAVLGRLLVIRLKWEEYVRPAALTYPCAAALFTFSLWLVLFA